MSFYMIAVMLHCVVIVVDKCINGNVLRPISVYNKFK